MSSTRSWSHGNVNQGTREQATGSGEAYDAAARGAQTKGHWLLVTSKNIWQAGSTVAVATAVTVKKV